MNKTALVTGCAGFIGSHLAERLLDLGYRVIGVDCFTNAYSLETKQSNLTNILVNPDFKLLIKDIQNLSHRDLSGVDAVFHLAAQAGVRPSWGLNFRTYVRNNIEATQWLLELCREKQVGKFVYASSSSVYGNSPQLPNVEDGLLMPESPYGVTKLAGEHLCTIYHRTYKVPTVSLRYFTVYGPRQRPDMAINKFTNAIINGQPITIYGNGEQTRDFTYVSDVARATIQASLVNEANGEIINVGGGCRISVNNLIAELEKIIGVKALVQFIECQKGDVRDTLANTNKAQSLLGWRAEVDIKEGLKQYVSYIRA